MQLLYRRRPVGLGLAGISHSSSLSSAPRSTVSSGSSDFCQFSHITWISALLAMDFHDHARKSLLTNRANTAVYRRGSGSGGQFAPL